MIVGSPARVYHQDKSEMTIITEEDEKPAPQDQETGLHVGYRLQILESG